MEALLAGTLEKRARWRKEWRARFCVMRADRIDYYLQPPALLGDDGAEPARGSIALHDAAPTEEPGRPHCLRVGDVLLSCATRPEQQRWLQAIRAAAGPPAASSISSSCPPARLRHRAATDEAEEPPLLLIPPRGPPQPLRWHESTALLLPAGEASASVLLLDWCGGGSGGSAEGCGARALCRVPLSAGVPEEPLCSVEPLAPEALEGTAAERRRLRVRVHSAAPEGAVLRELLAPANACLALAAAVLCAGGHAPGTLLVLLALCLTLAQPRLALTPPPRQRRVVFSAERLEPVPLDGPEPPLVLSPPPRWVGLWQLDKACSEKYEPILCDLGVNYLIRKAADAVNSALDISASRSHVTIHVKTIVSVEDRIPLDGSWTTKPVPPGSRMKGLVRVRLSKVCASELEMYSEFPDGGGDLRDTLVVSEDGRSFTRTVVRGALSVTRVFRRQ